MMALTWTLLWADEPCLLALRLPYISVLAIVAIAVLVHQFRSLLGQWFAWLTTLREREIAARHAGGRSMFTVRSAVPNAATAPPSPNRASNPNAHPVALATAASSAAVRTAIPAGRARAATPAGSGLQTDLPVAFLIAVGLLAAAMVLFSSRGNRGEGRAGPSSTRF